jgi:hypothetical protein
MMFLPTTSEVIPTLVFREIDRRRQNEPTLMEALTNLQRKATR